MDLGDCGVDALNLRVHGKLGALLRHFGDIELCLNGLIGVLPVLGLKLSISIFRCQLSDVIQAFRVVVSLRGEPNNGRTCRANSSP